MRLRKESSVRVGVIGCGYWGKNLIRNFYEMGALAAVSDIDEGVAAECSEKYGIPALQPDDFFESSEMDAVVIAVPAEEHAVLSLEAIASGKHVFVEKPIALVESDAQKMIDAAVDHGVTLMVGHVLRYHPCFRELRRIVRNGGIGRLQYVYTSRADTRTFRRDENALWSFAPHDVSMLLSLTGGLPDSVYAAGGAYLDKGDLDVVVSALKFPSGVSGHIFSSWLHFSKEQKLIAVGDAGMIVFDDREDWPEKLRLYRRPVSWENSRPVPIEAAAEPIRVERAEPLRLECEHFIDSVANGMTPITDGSEALDVLKVLCAVKNSMALRHPVELTATPIGNGRHPEPSFTVHETALVDKNVAIAHAGRI